jgi:hypothetical protein
MINFEIRWTREQWFKVSIEAENQEQAEAKFWEGNYQNEQMYGSEIQEEIDIFQIEEAE